MFYSFGNLNLCIEFDENICYEDKGNLSLFSCKFLENCHTFHFHLVDELSSPVGDLIYQDVSFVEYSLCRYVGSVMNGYQNAYMRICHDGMVHDVELLKKSVNGPIGDHVIYRAIECERLLSFKDVILLHAAYIQVNEKAILFTAPSGTGKSTQANLWKKYRNASIINGDRCAIDVKRGFAMGVPFAGSSKISLNVEMPISCIVYLKQASFNSIRQLSGYEAFSALYSGIGVFQHDYEHVLKISDLICELINQVPVYELSCTISEESVKVLEEVL